MVPELTRAIGVEGRALLTRFSLLKPLLEQMVLTLSGAAMATIPSAAVTETIRSVALTETISCAAATAMIASHLGWAVTRFRVARAMIRCRPLDQITTSLVGRVMIQSDPSATTMLCAVTPATTASLQAATI